MYMLVYYCATGYKQMKVMNGNGRGGSLEEIYNYEDLCNQGAKEVFLDNATGDYYVFKTVINKKFILSRKFKNGILQEM